MKLLYSSSDLVYAKSQTGVDVNEIIAGVVLLALSCIAVMFGILGWAEGRRYRILVAAGSAVMLAGAISIGHGIVDIGPH